MNVVLQTPWSDAWRVEFVGTLMVLCVDQEILLIHKKTGHGAGKVNMPGGKWRAGESLLECATRETYEEVGIRVSRASCVAELRFVELDGDQWLGFVFMAHDLRGTATESREALPFWCSMAEIPYSNMWPSDAAWLPKILQESPTSMLIGDFLFDNQQLVEHHVGYGKSIVDNFF